MKALASCKRSMLFVFMMKCKGYKAYNLQVGGFGENVTLLKAIALFLSQGDGNVTVEKY